MPKSKNFQRNFAIVIGINTYHNRIPPLQTAAPDAEELARILKEQHERLTEKYQKQQKYEVLLLLNEDATLDKLKQLLEDSIGEDSTLKLWDASDKLDKSNKKLEQISTPKNDQWHITANSQSNFAQTSRKLWWADVSWRTALSYDATQALIAALKQNPTRQGVAEILRSESFSVDGATGKVQFLPSGDRKNQLTNPLSQLVTIEPGSRSGYGYDFVAVP